MGWFQNATEYVANIFKGKKTGSQLKSLNVNSPHFTGESNPKLNETFVTGCNTHARHGSKIRPLVYYKGAVSSNKNTLNYLLSTRPNPAMNAPTFWEKVVLEYYMNNNALIFVERGDSIASDRVKALWIIPTDSVEIRSDEKQLYFRFRIGSQTYITDMNDMIILSRNVGFLVDTFGKIDKSIEQVIKIIKTNYEGLEQSIRMSAFIRFLVSTPTLLSEEQKEKRAKEFSDRYLGSESAGIAYIDAAQQVIQLDTAKGKYADSDVMGLLEKKVKDYLNINDAMLSANYNEDQFQAYYETNMEPIAIKIAAELTEKILSPREREVGNEIRVDANRLQTASLKTRAQVAAIIQKSPVHIPNVVNELLYIPPVEGGDEPYTFLNYAKTQEQKEQEEEDNITNPKPKEDK
jgi:HK97 family phage portal protein